MSGPAPNASQLSVRLWAEQDAAELERHLAEHIRDLALGGSRDAKMLSVRRIVEAPGRAERDKATGHLKSYDAKAVSPQLSGEIARSILLGAPYPQALLATMVRRIRADQEVSFARVSAIKAVLVRNTRLAGKPIYVRERAVLNTLHAEAYAAKDWTRSRVCQRKKQTHAR